MTGLILSALLGWLVGGVANRAADVLPDVNETDRSNRHWRFNLRHDWTIWWYPFRRGTCPHCEERRGLRAPLLEAAMILAFVLEWRIFGPVLPSLAIAWAYTAFLLLVLVIDVEHRRVLNVMTGPATVAVLLISFLPGGPDPIQALLGGAIGFGLFLAIAIVGRGALGAGDVKLAGLIGLMTGYPGAVAALVIGMILGGIGALVLLVTRRAGRKSTMAYAPYLSVGALLILLQALR